jgi:hypothetical protein
LVNWAGDPHSGLFQEDQGVSVKQGAAEGGFAELGDEFFGGTSFDYRGLAL